MKRQIQIVSILTVILFVLVVTMTAMASPARSVAGGGHWAFSSSDAWVNINIKEIAPGQASGWSQIRENDHEVGWRRWTGDAVCIDFGSGPEGEPAVSYVLQISHISGQGFPGQVGQYVKLWLSDGGTPAAAGDLAGLNVWPPQDSQPECGYEPPFFSFPITGGNIVIHHFP